jgi:hypothetical protein
VCVVEVFGSYSTCLSIPSSDLDLVVVLRDTDVLDNPDLLNDNNSSDNNDNNNNSNNNHSNNSINSNSSNNNTSGHALKYGEAPRWRIRPQTGFVPRAMANGRTIPGKIYVVVVVVVVLLLLLLLVVVVVMVLF